MTSTTAALLTAARLTAALLTAVLSALLALTTAGPSRAAGPPPIGEVVTITLTSDTRVNDSIIWADAQGRLRSQTDAPLDTENSQTHRWSSSMTLVRSPVDATYRATAAILVSGGSYAECSVRVDDETISHDVAEGSGAVAVCD